MKRMLVAISMPFNDVGNAVDFLISPARSPHGCSVVTFFISCYLCVCVCVCVCVHARICLLLNMYEKKCAVPEWPLRSTGSLELAFYFCIRFDVFLSKRSLNVPVKDFARVDGLDRNISLHSYH